MKKNLVGIKKYEDRTENIRNVLEVSGCLEKMQKLKPSDKVLLKPNLVMWDTRFPYPPFGAVTTSVVLEEVVKILKEIGCNNITIGEGATDNKDLNSNSKSAFEGMGLNKLQDRYGVKLVDFNDEEFINLRYNSHYELEVAKEAKETDFLINLPVLKTHNLTKVTLGFKNYIGSISLASKMLSHHKSSPLEMLISFLGENLYADVTLLDGIYSMERGPSIFGKAYRTNVLIASTDMFSADIVGAKALGYEPEEIEHLRKYAEKKGLSLKLDQVEIVGEPLEAVTVPLKWDWPWLENDGGPPIFERMGVENVRFPKFDDTVCAGCSGMVNIFMMMLLLSHQKTPLKDLEILTGKRMTSLGGYEKTLLYGDCMIEANKNNSFINTPVEFKGCPPSIEETIQKFQEAGIAADIEDYRKYRQSLMDKFEGKVEFNEADFTIK